jgi:hypothetical protein
VLEFNVIVQPWCTHHPPNEQLLVGMVVGAPSSIVHRSYGGGAVVFNVIVWPCWCWGSVSSYDPGAPTIHPMSSCLSAWQWVLCCLLSVAAVEGGPYGVVELFLHVSVTWCAHGGLLGAYRASIPLLGTLGIPQHPPSPRQQPHILFEQGGDFGGHGCVLCVLCHCQLSPVEYSLKINRIQLVN